MDGWWLVAAEGDGACTLVHKLGSGCLRVWCEWGGGGEVGRDREKWVVAWL